MDLWTKIVRLLPELRAYARSISDEPADAEDLVNDAVERAAKAERHPEDLDQLRPWMFRIIRNLNTDELRKRRVRAEYPGVHGRLLHEMPSSAPGADDVVLIRTAFEKLTPNEREIPFLVDVMGMKYAEAASVLDVPQGTVMSRISRARRSLLDLVAPAEVKPMVRTDTKKRR